MSSQLLMIEDDSRLAQMVGEYLGQSGLSPGMMMSPSRTPSSGISQPGQKRHQNRQQTKMETETIRSQPSITSAGDYAWQAAVTKGGERYTVGSGSLTVEKSFAAQATLDTRSTARSMLEALEACYLAYLTNGQGHVAEYEIAGRRMKFRNAAEIWQQIEKLKREVAAEDRAARIAAGLTPVRRAI